MGGNSNSIGGGSNLFLNGMTTDLFTNSTSNTLNPQLFTPNANTADLLSGNTDAWKALMNTYPSGTNALQGGGRLSSTPEDLAAIANGAKGSDFTPIQQANLLNKGVEPGILGLNAKEVANLPAPKEIKRSELTPEGLALQDFFVNANGRVDQLANANIDPGTRAVVFPQSMGLFYDGTQNPNATSLDKDSLFSSLNGGARPNGGNKLAQESTGGESSKPGTAKLVEPHRTPEEQEAAFRNVKEGKTTTNYMINNNYGLSAAALKTYAEGKRGVRVLPDIEKSKIYWTEPTKENVNNLVDRVFTGKSKTPGTQRVMEDIKALKPGESLTFYDHQDKLLNIRDIKQDKSLSIEEKNRIMTLGNTTLNTNAAVTVQYDGKNYTLNIKANHTIADTYDWNATSKNSAADAARTTFIPIGDELKAFNHADFASWKTLGASNYLTTAQADQNIKIKIPAYAVQDVQVFGTGVKIPVAWSEGQASSYDQKIESQKVITDPKTIRENLIRTSTQNPNTFEKSMIMGPINPLPKLEYQKGVSDENVSSKDPNPKNGNRIQG